MAPEGDSGDATLAPDDAFSVLGNETRMRILQTLAEADGPMSFSELFDHVGVTDSGQFNYHLDKLVGHFLRDADDGYELRRAGERVHEAIVSGAVTESPIIQPTEIEWPCMLCGASTELSYQEEWVGLSCTECPGYYSGTRVADESAPDEQLERGYLGGLSLPPAAIQGRTPLEVVQTAWTWDFLERLASSSGICPRCSASTVTTVEVCENHDSTGEPCEVCNSIRMITHDTTCDNCQYRQTGPFPIALNADTDLLAFVTSHGYNPVRPSVEALRELSDYEEELLSTEPFKAQFTWTLGEDTLTLTVDDELNVVEAIEQRGSAPD